VLNTPFSPWPFFDTEEVEAAARVIISGRVNYWTGSECREFEKEFADWCGTRHAVALSNGTLALDAALKALGVGMGDEVVVYFFGVLCRKRGCGTGFCRCGSG